MKEVVYELAGLAGNDHRHLGRARLYEERARQARARAYRQVFAAVLRGVVALGEALRRRRVEAAAIRELRMLDDRLLRDMGISRADIRGVVKGMVRRSGPETTTAGATLAVVPRRTPKPTPTAEATRPLRDAA